METIRLACSGERVTSKDADSPSVFPWRNFEYSATWRPLLTSVDGVAVTGASGYPTLIRGNALSWEVGRLLGYGSSTFGYDAQGNCVSRSGGGILNAWWRGKRKPI